MKFRKKSSDNILSPERAEFFQQLEEYLRLMNDTIDIDELFDLRRNSIENIEATQPQLKIDKSSVTSLIEMAVKDSLTRIFSVDVVVQIEGASKINDREARISQLNEILKHAEASLKKVPDKWLTPRLIGLYAASRDKIVKIIDGLQNQ